MSVFHDVSLPVALAFGASCGPELRTEVVRLASGREARNARWSRARRRWDVGGGVTDAASALALQTFFEARRARWAGFRFRDPLDWKSCAPDEAIAADDQLIGEGDGTRTVFHLVKAYLSGATSWARRITRPVADTVVVAVNGVAADGAMVDADAGLVTLGVAPAPGALVTAGFAFDVPVRFDSDQLEFSIEAFDAIRIGSAPLIEIIEQG